MKKKEKKRKRKKDEQFHNDLKEAFRMYKESK